MTTASDCQAHHMHCPARGFVYVWEGPVRVIHWLNVICIFILIMTGLYIHYPFVKSNPVDFPYMMGWVRTVHYFTAILFIMSVLMRGYWSFVGNKYASIKTFYNPFNKKDRAFIISYVKYYCFLEKKPPHVLTHNPMAQYAYIGIYIVFLFQIVSGLALWTQNNPDGTMYAIFGSIFTLVSNQWIRYFHFFVIFITVMFLMAHLYAAVLVDFRTHAGDISSIFSGWKAEIDD